MSNLAIIPARGGSKRIPKKNIKEFLGKPIIAYSIKAAIESGLFDEIMVSTDDEEIRNISIKYGAKVPFLRTNKNSDDYATLADVANEVINNYNLQGVYFENVCCILPTAPLIKPHSIIKGYFKLQEGSFTSVCPVVKFTYPILRALEISVDGKLKMVWPEHIKTRSQDLKTAYHDSGSFYWIKTEALKKEGTFFCNQGTAIILNESEVQDIDTMDDWRIAELKYHITHG